MATKTAPTTSRKKSSPAATAKPASDSKLQPLTDMDREEALVAILSLDPMLKLDVRACEMTGEGIKAVEKRLWSNRVGPKFEHRAPGEVSLTAMFDGVFAARELRSGTITWRDIAERIYDECAAARQAEGDEPEFRESEPPMEIRFPKAHNSQARIMLACDGRGKWRFGVDYRSNSGGTGWGPNSETEPAFASRSLAILAAFEALIDAPRRLGMHGVARERWLRVVEDARQGFAQSLPASERMLRTIEEIAKLPPKEYLAAVAAAEPAAETSGAQGDGHTPDESEYEPSTERHPDEPRSNIHGVFDDVETLVIPFPKSHKCEASIFLATDSEGWWHVGNDFWVGKGGGSYAPSIGEPRYSTRPHAIDAAITELIDAGVHRHHLHGDIAKRWVSVLQKFRDEYLKDLCGGGPSEEPAPVAQSAEPPAAAVATPTWEERTIAMSSLVVTNKNPRTLFEDEVTAELAETIRLHGLLQPPTVRVISDKRGKVETVTYQLIAGERRVRACQLLGWETIPVRIGGPDDKQTAVIRLVENLQRVDLSAIDTANAIKQLIAEHNYTQAEVGKILGCKQSNVSNHLRLLKLPPEWQARLNAQEIPPTHARYVLPYAEHPSILAALEEEFFTGDDARGVGTVNEFIDVVNDVVLNVTRLLTGQVYSQRLGRVVKVFSPTTEQLEQLQVIEVGEQPVAVNAELWDELQEAWIDSLVEQQGELPEQAELPMGGGVGAASEDAGAPALAINSGDEAAADEADDGPSLEQMGEEARAMRKAEQLAGWRSNWLRMLLAEKYEVNTNFGLRALVMLLASDVNEVPVEIGRIEELLENELTSGGCKTPIERIARFDRPLEILADVIPTWFWKEGEPQMTFNNEQVEALAEGLGINLTAEWSREMAGHLTEAFYNMHSQAELVAFGEKLGMPCLNEYTKSQLVTALIEAPDNDLLPDEIRAVAVLKAPKKAAGKK